MSLCVVVWIYGVSQDNYTYVRFTGLFTSLRITLFRCKMKNLQKMKNKNLTVIQVNEHFALFIKYGRYLIILYKTQTPAAY